MATNNLFRRVTFLKAKQYHSVFLAGQRDFGTSLCFCRMRFFLVIVEEVLLYPIEFIR